LEIHSARRKLNSVLNILKSQNIPFGLLPLLVVFLFTLPFLTLVAQLGLAGKIDQTDFVWAFKNTLYQSFWSSIFILLFGLWGSMGLLYFERRWPKYIMLFEGLLLIPNVLPSLFIILSVLYLVSPFPFGRIGIILLHVIINLGLSSFTLKNLIRLKVSRMAELAYIEGAAFYRFFWYGIITYLKRDLFLIFLFFFSICFTSFQIPLVVGADTGTTIEVLIYEKILVDNDLSQALSLSLFQSLCVFVLTYFSKMAHQSKASDQAVFAIIEKPLGILIPTIATLILVIAPLKAIPHGLEQIQAIQFPFADLPHLLLQSFLIAMSTGLLTYCLGMIISYFAEYNILHRFFQSYLAPSPIIMGVFIYSLSWFKYLPNFLSLSIILCILWFSSLYRLYLAPTLFGLNNQIQTARTLGARSPLIFWSITLPQIAESLGQTAALAALWAVGEFALSGFISGEDFHLAMIIKTLSSHYRLSAAILLSWILLFSGLVCYFIFIGASRVLSRKSFLQL
jgi:thiamine transport system permease protein